MYKAIKFKNDNYLDTRGIIHKGKILADIIYPVGSVYISVNDINPADLFGGTWKKVVGQYLLAWDCEYGWTGGDWNTQYTTLTADQIPSHTHTRGTMNITGYFDPRWVDPSGGGSIMYIQNDSNSALYTSRPSSHGYWWAQTDVSGDAGTNGQYHTRVEFNAARNWTGATSAVGGGQGHRHYFEPPYFKCSVWYRIA